LVTLKQKAMDKEVVNKFRELKVKEREGEKIKKVSRYTYPNQVNNSKDH